MTILRSKLNAAGKGKAETDPKDDKDKGTPAPAATEDGGETETETEEERKKREEEEEREAGKNASAGADALSPAAAERLRVKGITSSADAKLLPTLAEHLAYEGDFSAEQAAGILKAAAADLPKAGAAGAGQYAANFRKTMNAEAPNPDVGAGEGEKVKVDPLLAAAAGLGLV